MRCLLLSSLTALLLAPPVGAGEEPRAIIHKALEAVGGQAVARQVGAVHVKARGRVAELGPAVVEAFQQPPDRYKAIWQVDFQGVKLHVVQVLNGRKGWTQDGPLFQEAGGGELARMRAEAHADYLSTLLPLLDDKAATLTLLPEVKLQNRPAVVVQVRSPGWPDVKLYFDRTSGLLVKREYQAPGPGKTSLEESYYSDYREVHSPAADEQTLRAARVGTNGAALVAFLRSQVASDAERARRQALIRNLGDTSFEVREKAKKELIARGPAVAGLLSQAAHDPDPEIAGRAKECLQAIGKPPETTVAAAAVRLVAQRKPPGAAAALLAYLPSAPDEAVAAQVQSALRAVAFSGGKPDPALVGAQEAKDPQQRAAARAALARGGKDTASRRLLLPGYKVAMKQIDYHDGKKQAELELTEVELFNKLDASLFAKP